MTTIIRKDPRAERIIRNRLHPQHEDYCRATIGDVRGPTGLLRKFPHQVGFIGPNGIKRIDRLFGNTATNTVKTTPQAQVDLLPLHQVIDPQFYIMVVPDLVGGRLTSQDKDILGLAHQLVQAYPEQRGAVVALCFGQIKEVQFDLAGVDRLLHLPDAQFVGYAPEARLQALMSVEKQFPIKHWLFPDSVHGGSDLGSRLAAKLAERPATQAWQVDVKHSICRAASASLDIVRATPRILMLLEQCAEPIEASRHEVLPLAVAAIAPVTNKIIDQGQLDVDPNSIPLAQAEFILSAGNGIHNWEQFHQAATCLGATEGASRVAVDAGFMPRARQVGATGTWVTARVYIAVGISGAIQHMQGIAPVDKVIAINTDPGCDMVKRAALSVIGDSEVILGELIEKVMAYRARTTTEENRHVA